MLKLDKMSDLRIIDAISPWVDPNNPPYNWSKAPLDEALVRPDDIIVRFEKYLKKVKALGYNAISLDDLAHMVILPIYSSSTKKYLKKFEELYKKIIEIAKREELKVFINFDLMFFNAEIEKSVGSSDKKIIELLTQLIKKLFDTYDVDGIITRFGESDGVDVKSRFKSRTIIKRPFQARKYIKNLLPIFEDKNKLWIFRTWTLGAYKIGDLIWNKKTFLKVFKNVNSHNFVISMKYGRGDFFRGLDLNPFFDLKSWQFIIELQTRREYDGFGELPYYTGWDYHYYLSKLKSHKNFSGVSVWCMTGGWKKSNRLTYLDNSSKWVELNTSSIIDSLNGAAPEESIKNYFKNPKMVDFLRLYNRLSYEIMYPSSQKERYYKRLIIPPITWLFWGNVSLNGLIASYHRVTYKRLKPVKNTDIEVLRKLGKNLSLKNVDFICDTLLILLTCRNYMYFGHDINNVNSKIKLYLDKYPNFLDFQVNKIKDSRVLKLLVRLAFRKRAKHRTIDNLLFNRLYASILIRLAFRLYSKNLPGYVNSQAMPIDTFIR